MKIGIINFHCAHNYGAMLQAYALQRNLEKEGHEAIIIDFEPYVIMQSYYIWHKKKFLNPKKILGVLKNYYKLKPKYDRFEEFKNKFMNTTKEKYEVINENTLKELNFNALICGSDQVWNMDLNGGLKEYLLNFCNDKKIKKISYAASIGTKHIKDKNIEIMKKELKTFNKISVRESDAVEILKKEFKLKATQVLDPVFLISKKEWEEIALMPQNFEVVKEEYILLYGLEENELFEETFKFIKDNFNFKIINISPIKKKSKFIDKTLYNVGPREFIGLIKNAKIVFTNSFHGTCFSIIFKKDFFVLAHSELNSRIENILKLTSLENHMIDKKITSKEKFENIIKFNNADINKLNEEIKNSKFFLNNSLH